MSDETAEIWQHALREATSLQTARKNCLDKTAERWRRADEEVRKNLPVGVKLVRTLRGHTEWVGRIAWSPDGRILASPSGDGKIILWNPKTGRPIHTFFGHEGGVSGISFKLDSEKLISFGWDGTIKIWDIPSKILLQSIEAHSDNVYGVAVSRNKKTLASCSHDGTAKLWDAETWCLIRTFRSHNHAVSSVIFSPNDSELATGSYDGFIKLWSREKGELNRTLNPNRGNWLSGGWVVNTEYSNDGKELTCTSDNIIMLWNLNNGKLIKSIEGHTKFIQAIGSSEDGKLLASKGSDDRINIWDCENWNLLATIQVPTSPYWLPGIAFHPHMPLLATVGSDPGTPEIERDRIIHIWEFDLPVLMGQLIRPSITYNSVKIVLLGDSGVGKTGLGWRLAHGEYKEHSSTHGQQFWQLNQLCRQRKDGAQCEAVLWDLAGQSDYRLIHALFLDDADLVLILFDATRNDDPLGGVEFWLKQLKIDTLSTNRTPTLLIAARSDRGTPHLTKDDLQNYCKQRGIAGYLLTSAKTGDGIEELIQQMRAMIPWEAKPATITTETFKRIKDFVLNLKEDSRRQEVVLAPEELRRRLEEIDNNWKFSDDEMLTAVGHLANHGYVTRLKTSQGDPRILLAPELLNNLAASFVLEARRNQKGLGSLEEQRLLSGGYKFPELEMLADVEKDILLDSAVVLFLEHNISFRETDPLNGRAYLVFPELINLKKLLITDDNPTEDGVAYTVSGTVENVYASLVVLMGYTQTFTRTNQWRDHARYEVASGDICGFRQEAKRDGELDLVLYFGTGTLASVRMLFQSLFENFLARHDLTVRRYEPVLCPNGHTLDRAIVRKKMSSGAEFAFCSDCGKKTIMPRAGQPVQLTKRQVEEMKTNRRAAHLRSLFENLLFRLKNYVTEQKIAVPDCFISYAWGNLEQERWVERSLATDLQKAGIVVVLDRWENAQIGSSVPRFVERVGKIKRVIVVGTPLYRKKYDNNEPMRSYVVAAEGDLIGNRMIDAEEEKESVLPLLLEGTAKSSFPILLQGRVYADFRKPESYFDKTLELLLGLYHISPRSPIAIEMRELLLRQRDL